MADVDDAAGAVEGMGDVCESAVPEHGVELMENVDFNWCLDDGDWVGMG